MKAEFLKIAGYPNTKKGLEQFYKEFDSEEKFFAKCGAKIKKAFPGMKIPKAQGGTNIFQNGTFQEPNAGLSSSATPGVSGMLQNLTGGEGAVGAIGNIMGNNPVQKVFDTIAGFKAQKEKVNQANQTAQTFGFMEDARASNKLYEQQNLQQARQDSYVRPEDNVLTGEELFPMYGVGTNVLAKKGAKIKANAGTFLGSTGQQWGGLGQQVGGTAVNSLMKGIGVGQDNDMGSQLGGDIGGTLGNAILPGIGGIAGKALGTIAGGLLDRSDTKIKRYQSQTDQSIKNMIGMDMGDYTQNKFGGHLKNGGKISYEMGGDIQTYGEGSVTPLSNNPYGGEMGMINGPSHEEGGVDMSIYGKPLEAEGGEPIVRMNEGGSVDENMVILGNLEPAPHMKKSAERFLGEKISGKKYKSIGKSLGEYDKKLNKTKDSNVEKASDYTPVNKLDRISLASIERNLSVVDEKQKKTATLIDGFAKMQNAEDDSVKAKNGLKMYAQKGKTITSKQKQAYLDQGYKIDPNNPFRLFKDGTDPITVEGNAGIEGGTETRVIQEAIAPIKDTYKGPLMDNDKWTKWYNSPAADAYKAKYIEGTPAITEEIETQGLKGFDSFELPGTPGDEIFIKDPEKNTPENKKDRKGMDWGWLNGMNLRGSDAEDFNQAALLPEAWAMANNKLEPVQAQKFSTRLRTPYDISLQDQLNENTASARSAERMAAYNPGQLASLKAQEYMADSRVLGDQFRQNKQFKDQIYSGNLQALNDADLKNLAIADQQYVRQEQAKSTTKAQDLEAIKSMTDKRLKHNLENQTLRVWENMYDYRYDPSGRAQYRGPNADFSEWELASNDPVDQERYEYERGPDGKLMRKEKTRTKAKDAPYQPSLSTIGIVSKNGSLVKKLKKYK